MFKKNLISPQVYIKVTDKSDYYSLTSTKSFSSGGGSGSGVSGVGNVGQTLQEITNTCTAVKYSQGYDPFVTYCFDNVLIGGVFRHSPYVECNYMV